MVNYGRKRIATDEEVTKYIRTSILSTGNVQSMDVYEYFNEAKRYIPHVDVCGLISTVKADYDTDLPTVPETEDEDTETKEIPAVPSIDEDRVKALINAAVAQAVAKATADFEKTQEPPVIKITLPDNTVINEISTDGFVPPVYFEELLQLVALRQHIYMVGPSGCGKSYVAKQIAKALDLNYASVSCSEGLSESEFAGRLIPGDGGVFEYVPSSFVTIYENGGVFLIDEIDSSNANTMTFMNNALANGEFYLDRRKDAPVVKRHKDFVCVAAANTYGLGADRLYVGRNQLDAATMDRFRAGFMEVDYDTNVEKKLCDRNVTEWGWKVRQIIMDYKLRKVMSTRVLMDISKQVRAGMSFTAAKKRYFADWDQNSRSKLTHDLLPR